MTDQRDELTRILGANVRQELPELQKLLDLCNHEHGGVDGMYRFYHQSFKVFHNLQDLTTRIVDAFKKVAPPAGEPKKWRPAYGSLNQWFMQIVSEGTGKHFSHETNDRWLQETRPIVEAYLHAKFFLEMMIKHADTLEQTPGFMDSGYAALLYLYTLR